MLTLDPQILLVPDALLERGVFQQDTYSDKRPLSDILTDQGEKRLFLAECEFRRIQTFLFDTPRLRDMVGANVLLGEVIREELPRLAIAAGATGIPVEGLNLPQANEKDPLAVAGPLDLDDPRMLYAQGILARDGGHFRAAFAKEDDARGFFAAARKILTRDVPGLRVEMFCSKLEQNGTKTELQMVSEQGGEAALIEAPLFRVCAARGTGAAEVIDGTGEAVSRDVFQRRSAYRRFRADGKAQDIISLMERASAGETPQDLQRLCGNDYLAVIHADGNDIGATAKLFVQENLKKAGEETAVSDAASYFRHEALYETYFHQTRVSFRRAVSSALDETIRHANPGAQVSPDSPGRAYQLLMLGGDDLLLVCQAKRAIPFLVSLARNLNEINPAMTFGAGLAIASPNVPFHHLNYLAESLAASSKRLYRRLREDGIPKSVVDWHVEKGSWTPDLKELRRKSAMFIANDGDEREIFLSLQRPLPILGEQEAAEKDSPPQLDTLAGLHAAALALREMNLVAGTGAEAARSQLRWLGEQLPLGRRWSERAFDELSDSTRTFLRRAGLTRLWQQQKKGCWSSPFLDLVEILEIENLATARPDPSGEVLVEKVMA